MQQYDGLVQVTLEEAKAIASSAGKNLQLWSADGNFVETIYPSPAYWKVFARNAGTGEGLEVVAKTQDVYEDPARIVDLPSGFGAVEAEVISLQEYEKLLMSQQLQDQGLLFSGKTSVKRFADNPSVDGYTDGFQQKPRRLTAYPWQRSEYEQAYRSGAKALAAQNTGRFS